MDKLSHFNPQGHARMVDVSGKTATMRTATAHGSVFVSPDTFGLIRAGQLKKGDVLAVAQVAGIMGAKNCSSLIPMCHPVALTGVDIAFELDDSALAVRIEATARCKGETGVEMEALTAVSCAALTVYDMCKAVQKDIVIGEICLVSKTGGLHGDYKREG